MWEEDPINAAMPTWNTWREQFQIYLEAYNIEGDIDEIALMFNDEASLGAFVIDAVAGAGVQAFNSARDIVTTRPFDTGYNVTYVFLRMDGEPMRVECMLIGKGGLSPLHKSVKWKAKNHPVAVHVSFKCKSLSDYQQVTKKMDEKLGCELVQKCSSRYGEFSYYDVWALTQSTGLYLKPRVNLGVSEDKKKTEDQPEADEERGEFGMPGIGGKHVTHENLQGLFQ